MNPDEIDVMKLTPEDYLKMQDHCKELERDNILQHEHILELERANSELSDTIHKMHDGCKRAVKLRKLLDEFFDIGRNEVVSDDEIQKRMKNLKNEIERIRRVTNSIDPSQTALKDADAKIQSANDRAANAKKEAKEAKERAESASERIRYLERKLRDVESLNDSLMKELARRQGCQTEIQEHDADIYQLDVLKYAPDYQHYMPNVLYAAIGICGEAGEVSELVKKYAYHGHAIDKDHLARELGDVLWYVSYMAHLFGYSLGEIMVMNQEKLAKRYPDGKFDEERSRNRKEGDI